MTAIGLFEKKNFSIYNAVILTQMSQESSVFNN